MDKNYIYLQKNRPRTLLTVLLVASTILTPLILYVPQILEKQSIWEMKYSDKYLEGGQKEGRESCIETGGSWRMIDKTDCQNSCDYLKGKYFCPSIAVRQEGCDCGFGRCWNGNSCDDFNPIELNKNSTEKDTSSHGDSKLKLEPISAWDYFDDRMLGEYCYVRDRNGEINHNELSKDFNTDPPNTNIKYVNKEFGISFEIPYNKNWGNKDCVVLPYFQYKTSGKTDEVVFGQPRAFVADQYLFSVAPARSSREIVDEQTNIVGGDPSPDPKAKKINNHETVTYESYGEIDSLIIEVIGGKHNYLFEEIMPSNNTGELEDIVSTLRFIE